MNDDPIARRALRAAERGTHPDAKRLVAAVPRLMREAARVRSARTALPEFESSALRLLPRLALGTAVVVLAATGFVFWDRWSGTATAASFESMMLGSGGAETDDPVLDALVDMERDDG